jgi:hypothetical protein
MANSGIILGGLTKIIACCSYERHIPLSYSHADANQLHRIALIVQS